MDKYYTPEIEELYVGLECEHTSHMLAFEVNDTSRIYKEKLNQTDLSNYLIWEIEEGGLEKFIRVKYLDQEDIESFGFISSNVIDVLKEEAEFIKGFEKDTYILYIQEDKKLVIYNQKEYDISNKITGNWTEEILFKGLIKNKSELKFILKCLKI